MNNKHNNEMEYNKIEAYAYKSQVKQERKQSRQMREMRKGRKVMWQSLDN